MPLDFDNPLDFCFDDDPLPVAPTNKRKKVIGLDDLFNDHKKEQEKKKRKSKASKTVKRYDSDDDDANETETKLAKTFQTFQKTIKEVDGEEVALDGRQKSNVDLGWGLEVFGTQKTSSKLSYPELGSSFLSQKSVNDELNSLMDINIEMEEPFLKELLLNGWLSKLIINRAYLEEPVAKWILNLLLYSSEESVMTSACKFWTDILLSNKDDASVVNSEWLPGFGELKTALESYGFQMLSQANRLPAVESSEGGLDAKGPPANIRVWIKFVDACCQVRSRYTIFSTLEVQELVEIVVCLFLDRRLLGLNVALHDCLLSAINFFEEVEWINSCEEVSKSIANRVPWNLNCLRAVECITAVDTHSKQLRSALAFQILRSSFAEMTDADDILKFLLSKNMKDRNCDLFSLYLHFVLIENWILYRTEAEPITNELWVGIIRKCSGQISNTDFRHCAQEIRNRASYLLQSTGNRRKSSTN